MEIFEMAEDKAVRLKSHHNKFLIADVDETTVTQHGNGTSTAARWTVEFDDDESNTTTIRLKSLKTKMYLSASEEPFKLGLSARRATQALTKSIEWVPVKEGHGRVMLRARSGTFLCANGSLLPWRNSVTHDMLSATTNIDWATWVVEVVERDPNATAIIGSSVSLVKSGGGEELRRTCSSPANRIGGGGISGSPVGSIKSVRTLSPRRQAMDSIRRSSSTSTGKNTKVAKSFNNRDPVIIDVDKPLPLEVRRAKQTFMEVKDLDFKTVFYSERIRQVESSISILHSYNNPNNHKGSTSNSKLLSLHDQLQTLKSDQRRSTNELNECGDFKEKKANMQTELQRVVAKARELQGREEMVDTVLQKARRKRVELLRELGKVEKEMRMAEEDQAKNEAEIEELCKVIGRRSELVKEMERDENVALKRKAMAERRMEQVEDRWDMIKASFYP